MRRGRSVRLGRASVLAILLLASVALVAPSAPRTAVRGTTSAPAAASLADLFGEPRRAIPYTEPGLGLAGAIPVGAPPPTAIPVLLAFPWSNQTALSAYLAALVDPSSPDYHAYVSEGAFDREYGAAPAAYALALAYLRSFAVSDVVTFADRGAISFSASPATVGAIFSTEIEEYRDNGSTYYAPTSAPELPAALAGGVLAVEGLSSYSALFTGNDASVALGRTSGSPPPPQPVGYLPPVSYSNFQLEYAPDFQVAYDELSLFQQYGYPTDEVIATILWAGANSTGGVVAPWVPAPIEAYYNQTLPAGEPTPTLHAIPVNGAPPPGPSAASDVTDTNLENTIDLEMVGSTAPGASLYNVYGPTRSEVNLDDAFTTALNNVSGLSVISNSWGAADSDSDATWLSDLEEAQMRGITVLAASGDSGDAASSPKWYGTQAEFPASAAFDTYGTVAVGGTTVDLAPSLTLVGASAQVVWYNGSAADTTVGSAGGISKVYAEPSWQASSLANGVIHGEGRGVPDLGADANNTLLTIDLNGFTYDATNATDGGPFTWGSGTSVACPLEAGIVATMDHALLADGGSALGYLDPAIYQLGDMQYTALPSSNDEIVGAIPTGTYNYSLPTAPFFDVLRGANKLFAAGFGYDLVTGWGSIDAYNFSMYFAPDLSSNVFGRLSGVEDNLTLDGLKVTSYGSASVYNASLQQNLFVANAFGAPIYWIQNVLYINGSEQAGWAINDSGWIVFPYWGQYYYQSVYLYNFPSGGVVPLPANFDVKTVLSPGDGFANQSVDFFVGSHEVSLSAPGAAYIIGSYSYTYSWQGENYTNGPLGGYGPGGLDPQFGLVGGPTLGLGAFKSPTAGNLTAWIEPFGSRTFVPADTQSYGQDRDQTGETASGLAYTSTGNNSWQLSVEDGSSTQGVLSYEPSATFPVTFSSVGLPSGTPWSVSIAGLDRSTTGGAITVDLANGTYPYTVSTGPPYAPTVANGNVTVNGRSLGVDVEFARAYAVEIGEVGLPNGASWYVNVSATANLSARVSGAEGTTISFSLVNGSYAYALATSFKNWSTAVFRTLTVNGSPLTESVTFSIVDYTVTFTESGLPVGAVWSVNVSGGPTLSGLVANDNGTPLFAALPNGTYAFLPASNLSGWHPVPPNSTFTVRGVDIAAPAIAFARALYAVTLFEVGLLEGTPWQASVDGERNTTTAPSALGFSLPNGSFTYLVAPIRGYSAPWSGPVTIDGGPSSITIPFRPVLYALSFEERNVPNGTVWSVTIGSSTVSAAAPRAVVFDLVNDTYAYTASAPNATSVAGSADVDGAPLTVLVNFTATPSGGGASATNWLLVGLVLGVVGVAVVFLVVSLRRP